MLGEGNNIKPTLLIKEVELVALRFRSSCLDILTSTGLQESSDVSACQFFSSNENLEGDHKQECDFILLEQTSIDVFMHMFCHDLDDKVDSFLWGIGFWRFLR